MIEDEAALLSDIRFPLRGLNPWPPKASVRPSEEYAEAALSAYDRPREVVSGFAMTQACRASCSTFASTRFFAAACWSLGSSASETSAVTPLGPEHAKDGVPDTIRFD